jgi:hypothetical protein
LKAARRPRAFCHLEQDEQALPLAFVIDAAVSGATHDMNAGN